MRIATVSLPNLEDVVAAVEGSNADLIEVRLDNLWHAVPEEAIAANALIQLTETGKPLLATLRPVRQGGFFEGSESIRINLLLAAAQSGFTAVDLELDHPHLAKILQPFREHCKIVVSQHDATAPLREAGLKTLLAMQDLHVDIQKYAFPAGSFLDILRALELAHAHRDRSGRPAVLPMGASAEVRALLMLVGNVATYGYADGSAPAVQGQPSMAAIDDVFRRWGTEPTGHGGWYAVLGTPVHHSLSPRIHNAALRHAGRSQRCGSLEVPDSAGAFRLLATAGARLGLLGASVTHPHKAHAADVTAGDAIATATGAANCIRFRDGASTNTDALALRDLLAGSESVAILGSGGAAKAALWAARENDIPATLIARDAAAADVASSFGAQFVAWAERATVDAAAWVQATTLGMKGEASPVPPRGTLAVELVYADGPTDFQQQADKAGLNVIDGRRFVLEQAVHAYKFWTGEEPDRKAMEAALE